MSQHPIHVFINKRKYDLDDPLQTGGSLKERAGIPLSDVLFLQRPGDDEVITNESEVTLRNGDHLHSQPPADYGADDLCPLLVEAGLAPDRAVLHRGAGGWSFLVISNYELPQGYRPERVHVLVKLPPGFPDAAPDMFWLHPAVTTVSGSLPRATSIERVLGEDWQRFSWHLAPGVWKPGVSTLRDFLRSVRTRFVRMD
jgi:hypothetical protein